MNIYANHVGGSASEMKDLYYGSSFNPYKVV